ncbi:MAG: efflux RND transporter periplasmic adaptor subunit [Hyphomicrobium aestuarii]|nr:efflux RND transporter periplasmic adaptor subunit [Hyphomicrobium aestuarii]
MKSSIVMLAILSGALSAALTAYAMDPAKVSGLIAAQLGRIPLAAQTFATAGAPGPAALSAQAARPAGGRPAGAPPSGAPPSGARPTVVRTVNPQAITTGPSITLLGRTAAVEQAAIAARATGYVSERLVDIGDKVKGGDVLLRIDAPEIEHQIARLKAVVEQAMARQELAEQTADRGQALVQSGTLSKQTRDERRANERSADADVAAARADVRRLEELQKFLTVRAPFDGTIVTRFVDRGDRVTGGDSQAGSVLMRIARLEALKVQIDVPQAAAMSLTLDGPAQITFAELPGQTFEAKVSRISRVIDPESATMRTELLMANPGERIVAGLTGQVQLQLTNGPAVVTVPTNTLVIRNGRQNVAVVDVGTAKFRSVIVGRDLGTRVEILGGISANDTVILSPNALIREGDAVEIQVATPAT